METFAKNLDDAVERLVRDGATIAGRPARIKRRVQMLMEEIEGMQMHLDHQCSERLKHLYSQLLFGDIGDPGLCHNLKSCLAFCCG